MAKVKTKAPISKIVGAVGRTDKSKGRDGGMAASLWNTYPDGVYVAPAAHVRKRSAAQIARANRYCYCDQKFKELSSQKIAHVREWYLWTYNLKNVKLSNYHLWMRICLKGWLEGDLFAPFCWAGRYHYINNTGATLPAQTISLLDVPFFDPSGTDNEVHQLRGLRMDAYPVPRVVAAPGILDIAAPSLQPGSYIDFMVYAYADV